MGLASAAPIARSRLMSRVDRHTSGVALLPDRVSNHMPKMDLPETENAAPHVEAGRAVGFALGWVAPVAALAGAILALSLGLDPHENPDAHAFEAIARSLMAGQGFVYHEPIFPSLPRLAFRSPGYSAFLALGLLLGGVTAVVALQGAMHGLGAALLGDVAGRLAGPRAAWIALALQFAWPRGWTLAGQLLSETMCQFTLILALWLTVRAAAGGRAGVAAAAGGAGALAILTRPTSLGPVAVLTVWLGRRHPRAALALVLAALVTWAPWPIRNYARLHAFVPFQTMGGVALYNSHSDQSPDAAWNYMAEHTELGEVGFDRHFSREALLLVRTHPADAARRIWRATLDYMGPILDRRRLVWLHRFAMLAVLPALVWPDARRRLALPFSIWAAFGALLIPIVVNPRYRFPSEWCVVLGAGIGLSALTDRLGVRRAAIAAAIGLAVCVAFTLAVSRP